MSKLIWEDLMDAMHEDTCPLCTLLHEETLKTMNNLLYDSVNDIDLRARINRENGFCNAHAFQLLDLGDPLAHAIVYEDLLSRNIAQLAGGKRLPSSDKCVFCENEQKLEDAYVTAFLRAYEDNSRFRTAYEEGGLLCLPHLGMLLKKKSRLPELSSVTTRKYRGIIDDLREIQKRFDYRFAQEPWQENHRTAWKKAVELMNAARGLR